MPFAFFVYWSNNIQNKKQVSIDVNLIDPTNYQMELKELVFVDDSCCVPSILWLGVNVMEEAYHLDPGRWLVQLV